MDLTLKHSKKCNRFIFVTDALQPGKNLKLVFKAEYVRYDPETQENTTLKTEVISAFEFSQWYFQKRVDERWRVAKPI